MMNALTQRCNDAGGVDDESCPEKEFACCQIIGSLYRDGIGVHFFVHALSNHLPIPLGFHLIYEGCKIWKYTMGFLYMFPDYFQISVRYNSDVKMPHNLC